MRFKPQLVTEYSLKAFIPIIYRVVKISPDAIKKIMGKVEINQNKTQHLLTIEMLPSYRQLLLVNNMKELLKSLPRQTGLLSFNYICPLITIYNQEILLENGNFNEGARNLYTALHQLDNLKLARIITAQLLNIGIGIAVNNRL